MPRATSRASRLMSRWRQVAAWQVYSALVLAFVVVTILLVTGLPSWLAVTLYRILAIVSVFAVLSREEFAETVRKRSSSKGAHRLLRALRVLIIFAAALVI